MKPISRLRFLRLLLFLLFGVTFTICIIGLRNQSRSQADVEAASTKVNAARGAASDVSKQIPYLLKKGTTARAAGDPGGERPGESLATRHGREPPAGRANLSVLSHGYHGFREQDY